MSSLFREAARRNDAASGLLPDPPLDEANTTEPIPVNVSREPSVGGRRAVAKPREAMPRRRLTGGVAFG
jgi:hypothetical protein